MSRTRDAARGGMLTLARLALEPMARRGPRSEAPHVLVVQPGHLGDALLATPALALLEAGLAEPGARFSYLVGSWSAELAQHGPMGNHVSTLPFPAFTRRRKESLLAPYGLLARTAATLRAQRFDAALLLRPDDWWSALLALAAGIPIRVGGDRPLIGPLLTHRARLDGQAHSAEQQEEIARLGLRALGIDVPAVQGGLRFAVSAAESDRADFLLAGVRQEGTPLVAIHASAGAALKSWPVQRWAELAQRLHDDGCAVMLSGGPADEPLLAAIQAGLRRPADAVLLGQPIGVLAAAYRRCDLVVGPDSGPLHLAQAVGTPTVRLYGPAPASLFGPWPPALDQRVLVTDTLTCVPCGVLERPPCGVETLPPCMLALTVEAVLDEIRSLLAHAGQSPV